MTHEHPKTVLWAAAVVFLVAGAAWGQDSDDAESDEKQPQTAPAATQPTGPLIEGLVLNYVGGGIAGARVRIEALDARPDDPPLAECETSKSGDISVRLPRPVNTKVRVRIQMDGYDEYVQEIDPTDPDEPPFIDATLEGAASISGVVRARSTGKPVKDAKVMCESGGRELTAKTDAQGRYTLKGVVRGQARLKVRADGFATVRLGIEVEDAKTEEDIELLAERPVELTVVTSEGDPANEVLIEGWIESSNTYVEAMTDARGRAMLRGVGEEVEEIRVRLNGPDYVRMTDFEERIEITTSQPATDTMPEGPAPVRQRIIVHRAAKALGTVTNAAGAPVVGVRVTAGRTLRSNMPVTWTGQEGTYELKGLPAAKVTLTFQHPDYAPDVREVELKTDQPGKADVKLDEGGPIAGQVLDSDNQPIEHAWLAVEDWKGYQTIGMRVATDKDGKFLFEHAPEGEITFTVVKAGYGGPIRQAMTAGKKDYRIVLERSAAVAEGGGRGPTGEVRIAVGRTVPDFTLTGVDGTRYKLSEMKGKYVFLDFWASWCPPCVKEMPNIKALHEAMKDRADFVLIGVNLDSETKDFKTFVEKNKIAWPQVSGPESGAEETFEMLDGLGIPYTCLIGPDGRMIAQHLFGSKTTEEVKKNLKD